MAKDNLAKAKELADSGSSSSMFTRALTYATIALVEAVREQNVILAEDDESPLYVTRDESHLDSSCGNPSCQPVYVTPDPSSGIRPRFGPGSRFEEPRIGDGDVGTVSDEPPWEEPAPWRAEEHAVYEGLPFGSKPTDWAAGNAYVYYGPEVVLIEGDDGKIRPATKAETMGRLISEKHIKPTDEIKIENDQ